MSIDAIKVYSFLSKLGQKDSAEQKKVVNFFEELATIDTANGAKEFLEEKFNITEGQATYYLCADVVLSVADRDDVYTVQLNYKNENIWYRYKK